MNDPIRISAVIPAYNAEEYLPRSIQSALAQTVKPFEILLIDDGSTDGTAELVKRYGDSLRYIYQANGGEATARNAGVLQARGNWIAFLDADDEWRAQHLEIAMAVLETHPELRWYSAAVHTYIHETGRLLAAYKEKRPGTLIDNAYFEDYMMAFPPYAHFSSPTMIISKSVFEKVGMFDINKTIGCDIDMWYRIGLHFPQVGYSHQVGANIYRRKSSLSYTTTKPFDDSLERIKAHEILARSVGESARRRAEPRIMYWVTKLLRASLSRGDTPAVREIVATYGRRLAPGWRLAARVYLAAPWATRPAFWLRNTISVKQRAFRAAGLR